MSMVQAGAGDRRGDRRDRCRTSTRGDVVIDGGNANFRDTQRRHAALAEQGDPLPRRRRLRRRGGRARTARASCPAATGSPTTSRSSRSSRRSRREVDGTPCCTYVGPDGAGHYVKMVHNGIEYADMQLIAESYDLLRHGAGLEVPEIAERFRAWNESELESFLIEISARVLAKTDERTGQPLVDVILDAAEQKGTGRWTAQNALELGVPLTGITEAVFARTLSALKAERQSPPPARWPGPSGRGPATRRLADDLEHALYASKIVSYAQGFAQMAAASEAEGWEHRPRLDGDDLARRLHHPRPLPRPHPRGLRRRSRSSRNLMLADFFAAALRGGSGSVAAGRRQGRRAGDPDARVLLLAGLLRRLPARPRTRQPDPGPARPVRRAHLPARRPRRHVPRHVGRRRARSGGLIRGAETNAGSIRT